MKRLMTTLLTLAMLLALLPTAALADQQPSTDTYCNSSMSGKHSWGEWTITKEATCTQAGSRTRTCSGCGYQQTETIKKTGHSWGKWKTTEDATCTKQGEQTRKCKVCGKKDTRKTEKLAHTWGEWTVVVEPTDHSAGTRKRACRVCGTESTREFDPEGTLRRGSKGKAVKALQEGLICYGVLTGSADGSFGRGTEKAVMAAQEAEGLTADGVAWPQTQARLGHRFGEWQVLSEKTDFSVGLRRRICERCGIAEDEEDWPEPTYRRGDRGEGVRDLQEKLNAAGYDCGKADGDFGGKTERAVKAIEEAHGVEADGIAWPGVQKWLEPATAGFPAVMSNGDSAADFLGKLRNWPDDVDGTFAPLEIIVQPAGGDIDPESGETLTLSVQASGGVEPYEYHWYRFVAFNEEAGRPMGHPVGDDEDEYPADAPGGYYCRVSDDAEHEVYSDVAEVTSKLYISRQPQNASLYGKESVTLDCVAMGGKPFDNGTYIYAWYNSADEQISFSDQGALEVTELGEYYCVVDDHYDGHVTSETVTVYNAQPLQCSEYTEPVHVVETKDIEIYARFSGGVPPYTAEWTLDDEAVPMSNVVDSGSDVAYYALANDFGAYTCTVTDSMGDTAKAEVPVEYAQLAIARPPEGGMLPQDGSGLWIEVVMAEGTAPFTYDLYHAGVPKEFGKGPGMSGGFRVYEPGYYFIHIQDAEFRWATTDPVLVQDYEFHIDALNVSGPISGAKDGQTLAAVVVGGDEPITYRWFRKGGYNGDALSDTSEPSRHIELPGEYHCEAEDKNGNIAISPSVKVEYTGDVPIIVLQPQDVALPYAKSGEYSTDLTCLAASGSPTTPYHSPISYTWERKGESGWLYNREQGPTIPVTEPGIYRCICRDTYSGKATISRKAIVGVALSCEITDYSPLNEEKYRLEFEIQGGFSPYEVKIYQHRIARMEVDPEQNRYESVYEDVLYATQTKSQPGKGCWEVPAEYDYTAIMGGTPEQQSATYEYYVAVTDANRKETKSDLAEAGDLW